MDARPSLVRFLGHVRPALGIQVGHQGFHSSTKGVQQILDAVVFKGPQHAINSGCPSHIHRSFGEFIYGSEIACQPVSVGEIETVAPCLKKGLTRFQPKAERNIIALHITTASRDRHTQKQKYWNQQVYRSESSCMTHAPSPLCLTQTPSCGTELAPRTYRRHQCGTRR